MRCLSMVLMLAVRISGMPPWKARARCGLSMMLVVAWRTSRMASGLSTSRPSLDHDAERGKDVVEDDHLRILGLDAFGQLRLGAADGLTQLAALGLQVVERDESAGIAGR
jgi:hypothetical protein